MRAAAVRRCACGRAIQARYQHSRPACAWCLKQKPIPKPPDNYTCPHCAGITSRDCCICKGTQQVSRDVADRAVAHVWAKWRCTCEVCRIVGPGPK